MQCSSAMVALSIAKITYTNVMRHVTTLHDLTIPDGKLATWLTWAQLTNPWKSLNSSLSSCKTRQEEEEGTSYARPDCARLVMPSHLGIPLRLAAALAST